MKCKFLRTPNTISNNSHKNNQYQTGESRKSVLVLLLHFAVHSVDILCKRKDTWASEEFGSKAVGYYYYFISNCLW